MSGFSSDDPRCYDRIPSYTRAALDDWAATGRPKGGFVTAVLSNDLKEAVGLADDHNLGAIVAIVAYLYNEVPSACWGSPERVKQWMADKNKEE